MAGTSAAAFWKSGSSPRLQELDPDAIVDGSGNVDPVLAWPYLKGSEKPGGHGERSVAVWDLAAKLAEVPLWRMIADRWNGGRVREQVFTYAAGRYYHPGQGLDALKDEMRSYLDRGYRRMQDEDRRRKPGRGLGPDRSRAGGRRPRSEPGVDANGRFDLDTACQYAEAIEQYDLLWYEEAGDPMDCALQAELANRYEGPMATGENLFSHQDARNLLLWRHAFRSRLAADRSGSLLPPSRVQEDPGPASRVRFLGAQLHSAWRLFALCIAAGLEMGGNESYPNMFQPFDGFADEIAVEDGEVGLHRSPGVGFEEKANLIAAIRRATET